MKSIRLLILLVSLAELPGLAEEGSGESRRAVVTTAAVATNASCSTETAKTADLPPLPEGVSELRFGEFFKSPVGPRGLELTDKLRRLDGQRVRLLGYMIHQTEPTPRCFLFAPRPVLLHEHEYGFADELPASTVHVFTDTNSPPEVPFTPGLLLLTGRLNLGNRQEASGRVSLVRLQLDPPTDTQRKTSLGEPHPTAPGPDRRSPAPHGHSR